VNATTPAPARATVPRPTAATSGAMAPTPPTTLQERFDLLDRVARYWEAAIESTLESHAFAAHTVPPRDPLPQWAVDRLNALGRYEGGFPKSGEIYRQHRAEVREAIGLATGAGSKYRYEIWVPRGEGRVIRLERRCETLMEARERLAEVSAEFPTAYVAQVHVRDTANARGGVELLDTMIGAIWHAGTSFPQDGDEIFELQDSTGRTVSVPAPVLLEHPIYERLSDEAKAAVEYAIQRVFKKAQRATVQGAGK
jgi:hypothetical protein